MIRGLAASGLQSVSLPTTDGEICRTRHIYTCRTLRNGCSRCAGIFAAAVQAELACRTWRHLQPRGLIVLPPLSSFALPPSPPFSRGTPVALPPSLSSLPPPPRPSDASAILPAVGRGKTPLTSHSITRQGDILSSIQELSRTQQKLGGKGGPIDMMTRRNRW